MLSRKSTFFLAVLTLSFAIALCFPWAAIAQLEIQQLIPIFPAESSAEEKHPSQDFVVYGRAGASIAEDANLEIEDRKNMLDEAQRKVGIASNVEYRPIPKSQLSPDENSERMPDLEKFFEFGGTLEILTTDLTLTRYDLVISEIMWGIDEGLGATDLEHQNTQWIELYNTTDTEIPAELYFLFTPLKSHPARDEVNDQDLNDDGNPKIYKVLDAVSTLFISPWELPGDSGKSPNIEFISTYRKIDYEVVEDKNLERRAQLSGIPFGSYLDSWEETPENGRRNTLLTIPCIATPGARHILGIDTGPPDELPVYSDIIVINEVRNDTSRDNIDWVELKNISGTEIQIDDWELNIVTSVNNVNKESILVDLPEYELNPDEILLLLNKDPWFTPIVDSVNITEEAHRLIEPLRSHYIDEKLDLPNDKRFLLLLRSELGQRGRDKSIEDYAGNGFFVSTSPNFNTGFWPRVGQRIPTNVADFGEDTFASRSNAWARIRHNEENDGHHEDAWQEVGIQGGLGYDPGADLSTSPGTPGYENNAIKIKPDDRSFRTRTTELELTDGEVSISEIMSDPGPDWNQAQWIELYNSSLTQAINIKDWVLEIYNIHDDTGSYAGGNLTFNDAIILPNQTLLLVSKKAINNVPSNRVYDISKRHGNEFILTGRRHLLLNPDGFFLRLRTEPLLRFQDPVIVDEVGNIDGKRANPEKLWELPKPRPEERRSMVRQYDDIFRPKYDEFDGEPDFPLVGTDEEGWRKARGHFLGWTYYGNRADLGTPGYRVGGPLPVELSSFRPVRMETGEVLIKWTTESELNNAGFNILRSDSRENGFTVINLRGIIPGQGTSSERHDYQWRDTTAAPNVVHYYRIEDVSFEGIRQTLATVRLKGDISASGKLTTTWSSLKTRN